MTESDKIFFQGLKGKFVSPNNRNPNPPIFQVKDCKISNDKANLILDEQFSYTTDKLTFSNGWISEKEILDKFILSDTIEFKK